MSYFLTCIAIGIGATAFLDLWSWARNRVAGVPLPDYRLVGRWFAYMPRGRFCHPSITATKPVAGEALVGWVAHYAIGILFAFGLLAFAGEGWARQPTLGPALLIGIATVAAPLLLMQPAMGAGLAARRSPRPWAARARSLVTHAVFGAGLYLAALAISLPTQSGN
ncbi:MAG TPA: DUF2938 domain-containing protein [Verrucomicrobiae bacterium]|nr:DUF2938 domain-containing protein [Verrucomicrobiae bacterium]